MKSVFFVVLMMSLSGVLQAGDVVAGKKKALSSCAVCHGVAGISSNPLNPNLAGQNERYFIKAMKTYREGGRKDPMMGVVSKGLSDGDIENLAAFYGSLK